MRENHTWVEEAEARQARQFAAVQHATAEPRMAFAAAQPHPTVTQRLRNLALRLPAWVLRRQRSPSEAGKSV